VDGAVRLSIWRVAALCGVMALAAALRGWGVLSGELVWHPDEIFMAVYPLNMLSGDLNPHSFSYPGFHYSLLAGIYGLQFLLQSATGTAPALLEWVATRQVWAPEAARDTARWVSVAYSLATVFATGLLAGQLASGSHLSHWRAITSVAGIAATALAAVNILLVRQAPLAGTDAPLAFWFVAATLASVKLLRTEALIDYVLAGALVGVCATTKYPGAAAGSVIAAHLLARRGVFDRRLWLAGGVSIGAFLVLSPYTLLDYSTFQEYFLFQMKHAAEGRFGFEPGLLYHVRETLRYGTGWLAWLGWLSVCVWSLWKRPSPHLVVLAASASAYAAVNWGDLVFARYVLPLVPLQLALLGDGITRGCRHLAEGERIATASVVPVASMVTVILCLQPAYGAWHVVRLQRSTDTRSQARAWIESNVQPGSTLCNFGGWAGDPKLNTYEELWWRFRNYTNAYGQDLGPLRRARLDEDTPFYSYAVQRGNVNEATGSLSLLHSRGCSHLILHQHPLTYSRLDSTFHRQLAQEARLRVSYEPGDLRASTFDPMDAYYIPLAGWAALAPGPRIEIWEVERFAGRATSQTVTDILSRTLLLGAESKANTGDLDGARADLARARTIEPGSSFALEVEAIIAHSVGDLEAVESAFQEVLALDPESVPGLTGMAQLRAGQGEHSQAIDLYGRARRQRPRDAKLLNNLAVSYRAIGRSDTSRSLWLEALSLRQDYADAHFNLGTALYLDGAPRAALSNLNRAVELVPDSAKYHSNAAVAHRAAGLPLRAVELWQGAVRVDSSYVDAHFNLGYTYQYDLQSPQQALPHWERTRHLAPTDIDAALHGAQALMDLGRATDAVKWMRGFVDSNPQHPRRDEVEAALSVVAAADTAR